MTARSVLARVATAVAVLAGVVAIYLAVLLVTGADRQQRPPVGSLVLATTVVALVLQPLYRSLGVWFRRSGSDVHKVFLLVSWAPIRGITRVMGRVANNYKMS